MELRDYEVSQFNKGDFQDQNGNYWCDMALKGVGEPVRIVVKDPTQFHDNMTLYGKITEETSKAGRKYLRFRREKKEEGHTTTGSTDDYKDKPSGEYWDDKNAAIKAQFAIKASIEFHKTNPEASFRDIEDGAKKFYAMVERVKVESLKAPATTTVATTKHSVVVDEEADKDAEYQSLIANAYKMNGDESINLDDIPF